MDTSRLFDVASFGARSHAPETSTQAFQKAIDACAESGGGTVFVPPGEYVIGRVLLRSNVTFHLAAGALVKPSREKRDYPPVPNLPDSNYRAELLDNALNSRYAILYALNAVNVTVCGRGCIDGDDRAFWTKKNTGTYDEWNMIAQWFYYAPNAFRPVTLMFERCKNIVVRDVELVRASCYSGWFAGCTRLQFENVTVRNDHAGPNTDGFHFSSCRNVTITGCDFTCGDDCIAIDPNYGGIAENYTVSGCRFDTSVNAFRIYTGLDPGLPHEMPRGEVRNVVASTCIVANASGVFNVTAENGEIHHLMFSDFCIQMAYRGSAFFFIALERGRINRVTLSRMLIGTDGVGTIVSREKGAVRGIVLDGLDYVVSPRTKLYGNGAPPVLDSWGWHSFAPYNLYVRAADDVMIRDTKIVWTEGDLADLGKIPDGSPDWPAIECRDVNGLVLDNVICSAHGENRPDVLLVNVKSPEVASCRRVDGERATVEERHG